jgi:reverse gyrase
LIIGKTIYYGEYSTLCFQSTAAPTPAAKKRALVIVESPAKAKTINKYLGSQYVVKSSGGSRA